MKATQATVLVVVLVEAGGGGGVVGGGGGERLCVYGSGEGRCEQLLTLTTTPTPSCFMSFCALSHIGRSASSSAAPQHVSWPREEIVVKSELSEGTSLRRRSAGGAGELTK